MTIIDVDQHLFEPRELWAEHIDPDHRDDALRLDDDDLGYTWLTWRGRPLSMVDVSRPHETVAAGALKERQRAGERAPASYDELLPDDYWLPGARVGRIRQMGIDQAVLFPNFGLLWERPLSNDLPALRANMAAWNRWCATVVADGSGALHPVAHLTLRDPDWLGRQLAELSAAGVRLAMIAPALVDGRPLSHPDHEGLWSAFVDHGITPVFHVADQPRIIDDAWYTDTDHSAVPTLESVFLWTAPAVAVSDLIVNGVLDRHPDLRLGIIELGSVWVPLHLMMLDGGVDFTAKLNGRPLAPLSMRPSEYFQRQVRVASFAYESPAHLIKRAGDVFMCCSDYPHSEGTDTPLEDYARSGGTELSDARGLAHDNAAYLLRLDEQRGEV